MPYGAKTRLACSRRGKNPHKVHVRHKVKQLTFVTVKVKDLGVPSNLDGGSDIQKD